MKTLLEEEKNPSSRFFGSLKIDFSFKFSNENLNPLGALGSEDSISFSWSFIEKEKMSENPSSRSFGEEKVYSDWKEGVLVWNEQSKIGLSSAG